MSCDDGYDHHCAGDWARALRVLGNWSAAELYAQLVLMIQMEGTGVLYWAEIHLSFQSLVFSFL